MSAEPRFFATAAAFGAWLADHAGTDAELLVGFHKVDSGRPSMTWPQAVDEALCVGWVDGVRKRIDAHSYQIRFTPRKATSTWSAVNIDRVAALAAASRMQPAGLAAFGRRLEHKSRTYAYEQDGSAALSAEEALVFRARPAAWAFFEAQAPSYRHKAVWRIVSVKRTQTRASRLAALIEASSQGRRV